MSTFKQRSPVACARLPRILRIACALAAFLMLASAAATATGGELSVENFTFDGPLGRPRETPPEMLGSNQRSAKRFIRVPFCFTPASRAMSICRS